MTECSNHYGKALESFVSIGTGLLFYLKFILDKILDTCYYNITLINKEILSMSLSGLTTFLKSFWRELSIATLSLIVFGLHLQNEALSVAVSLKNQEITNIEERLKVSNASVSQLQVEIDTQNQKLNEANRVEQERLQKSKLELEKAKLTNEQLQKEIDEINDFKESGDVCKDIEKLLKSVGE